MERCGSMSLFVLDFQTNLCASSFQRYAKARLSNDNFIAIASKKNCADLEPNEPLIETDPGHLEISRDLNRREYFFLFLFLYLNQKSYPLLCYRIYEAVLFRKFADFGLNQITELLESQRFVYKEQIDSSVLTLLAKKLLNIETERQLFSFDFEIRELKKLFSKFSTEKPIGHPKGQFRRGHSDGKSGSSFRSQQLRIIHETNSYFYLSEEWKQKLQRSRERTKLFDSIELLQLSLKLKTCHRRVRFFENRGNSSTVSYR